MPDTYMHHPMIYQPLGMFTVAIFGSFSCIWQRNKQKGIKNDVKNGYRETPWKANLGKME